MVRLSQLPMKSHLTNRYFNSTMVRLKEPSYNYKRRTKEFQFHDGTIKRIDNEKNIDVDIFQFHDGTIKRNVVYWDGSTF